jgi:hypothetical protein
MPEKSLILQVATCHLYLCVMQIFMHLIQASLMTVDAHLNGVGVEPVLHEADAGIRRDPEVESEASTMP